MLENIISQLNDSAVALELSGTIPIRGSNITKCPRAVYQALNGVAAQPLNGQRARILQIGKENHIHLQRALWNAYVGDSRIVDDEVLCLIPITLPSGLTQTDLDFLRKHVAQWTHDGWEGHLQDQINPVTLVVPAHADSVISEDTPVAIVEIKTARDFAFKKRKEEGVDPSHALQVCAQAFGLEGGFHERAAKLELVVLYENKDNAELFACPVNYADYRHELDKYLSQMRNTVVGWLRGDATMAPAVYTAGIEEVSPGVKLPWQCNYCDIGPIAGGCTARKLKNTAKEGDVAKWQVAE